MGKERVNYVIEDGVYCASFVNLPIAIEANSFEEMKAEAKKMFRIVLDIHTQIYNTEDPFEFVNISPITPATSSRNNNFNQYCLNETEAKSLAHFLALPENRGNNYQLVFSVGGGIGISIVVICGEYKLDITDYSSW